MRDAEDYFKNTPIVYSLGDTRLVPITEAIAALNAARKEAIDEVVSKPNLYFNVGEKQGMIDIQPDPDFIENLKNSMK